MSSGYLYPRYNQQTLVNQETVGPETAQLTPALEDIVNWLVLWREKYGQRVIESERLLSIMALNPYQVVTDDSLTTWYYATAHYPQSRPPRTVIIVERTLPNQGSVLFTGDFDPVTIAGLPIDDPSIVSALSKSSPRDAASFLRGMTFIPEGDGAREIRPHHQYL